MLIGCGSITLASASLFKVKNPQYTADLEHRTPLAARSERRIGTMHTRTLFFFFFRCICLKPQGLAGRSLVAAMEEDWNLVSLDPAKKGF